MAMAEAENYFKSRLTGAELLKVAVNPSTSCAWQRLGDSEGGFDA